MNSEINFDERIKMEVKDDYIRIDKEVKSFNLNESGISFNSAQTAKFSHFPDDPAITIHQFTPQKEYKPPIQEIEILDDAITIVQDPNLMANLEDPAITVKTSI